MFLSKVLLGVLQDSGEFQVEYAYYLDALMLYMGWGFVGIAAVQYLHDLKVIRVCISWDVVIASD